MSKYFDLILKNANCFTVQGLEQIDIGIKDGVITEISNIGQENGAECLDLSGLTILPGVIDSQVHFREPGNEHKEDLESGTRSAVLGGVTTVFEMPNTKPATTTKEALEDKLSRANGRCWTDYAFFMGGTQEDKAWNDLESLPGCCGIKIFMGSSTGNLLVSEDEWIQNILSKSKRRTAVHCEDENILKENFHIAQDGKHPRFHPKWRSNLAAYNATKRLLTIARNTNHPVHVLHVTTAEEMELLAQNKDIATVEVLPQHLTLTDEVYESLGTFAQMNPPIRDSIHQEALWKAVQNGTVDVLGSDHAPHTIEEKNKEYPNSPSGMPGVQTLVPIMLNHVNNGKLSLNRFVDLTSWSQTRIYGIKKKGRIAVGYDADFTVVDLNRSEVISNSKMASKCGWTPYDGMKVQGWPVQTIIRGQLVMSDGELIGKPIGKTVNFIL
ncbi:MAG: dihydroorotase [Candidatus Caenarcaniphilales bacterium]|nr:dihydroorotase [Candidatus Caenarcaniphilales bacterium]